MTETSASIGESDASRPMPSFPIERKAKAERSQRRSALAPMVLGLLGALALLLLVRSVGWDILKTTLRTSIVWIPMLLLLEGARLGTDAFASLWSYGSHCAVPTGRLLTAQLIGTAAGTVTPAGRLAAEAVKATLLSPWIGGACAAAGATTSQAASLLATAAVSVPCTICAFVETGASTVTLALLTHTVGAAALGTGLRVGMRARRVVAWFRRKVPRAGNCARGFEQNAQSLRFVPSRPLAILLLGRVLQTAEYAILAIAVSGSTTPTHALLVQGVNLLGLAVGALVPAQLGLSDGAFALSADVIGVSAAQALSISLISHLIQGVYAAAGLGACMLWRAPSRATV